MQLSDRKLGIIDYCKRIRGMTSYEIDNKELYDLVDCLAQECGVTDVKIRCSDCGRWKYIGCVSGQELGRGICSVLSYKEGTWHDDILVEAQTLENKQYKINPEDSKNILTLGTFSCRFFYPRKRERDNNVE